MGNERAAGQEPEYACGKPCGNPPPHAAPIGSSGCCRPLREIGLRRDAGQFNRCPRKAVVDRRSRQRVERFPSPVKLVQLLSVLPVGREPTFDAATILRRKLAIEIGNDLVGCWIRLWISY